jgi:rare lipoprotein A
MDTRKRAALLALLLFCARPLPSLDSWAPQEGMASWYGPSFHGKRTASGEVYDMEKLTAAHRTLPFGTLVRVTNLANDRTVVVRINDRGPFVAGRVIDLSRAAARELDMLVSGTARVRLEAAASSGAPVLYRIQVGAFRNRDNALRASVALEGAGFHPVLERTPALLTRVTVSDISSAELTEALARLESLGFSRPLVTVQRSSKITGAR